MDKRITKMNKNLDYFHLPEKPTYEDILVKSWLCVEFLMATNKLQLLQIVVITILMDFSQSKKSVGNSKEKI